VFTSHATGDQIFYFVHHVLPILHIYFSGARFGCRAYARGLDKMIIAQVVGPLCTRTSPSTSWSERSALTPSRRSLYFRPVGWTDRCSPTSHSADQLVGLLGARRPVILPTNFLGFIVSFAGGSPAELGTPRCLSSSCKRRQLCWGLPRPSDFSTSRWSVHLLAYYVFTVLRAICAIKLLYAIRIRLLILGGTFGALIST
jgi:hypothetical protein